MRRRAPKRNVIIGLAYLYTLLVLLPIGVIWLS
jgi:hypothetical protein